MNVSNHLAREFYARQGVEAGDALELQHKNGETDAAMPDLPLMQCRYCLRYSLGYCVKHGGEKPTWREPLSLRLADGRAFQLEFDCKNCQMNLFLRVKKEKQPKSCLVE